MVERFRGPGRTPLSAFCKVHRDSQGAADFSLYGLGEPPMRRNNGAKYRRDDGGES